MSASSASTLAAAHPSRPAPADRSHPRRLAEERLERNRSLLRMAGEVARFGGWTLDLATLEVDWSDEVYAILEHPRTTSPAEASTLAMALDGHRERLVRAIDRCVATGERLDLEVVAVTRTGRRLTARVVGDAVRDLAGDVVAITGAFQDVTELRAAHVVGEQLALTLEHTSDGLYVLDHDWRIAFCNRRVADLLGADPSELLGRHLWDELGARGTELDAAFHRAIETGVTVALDEVELAPLAGCYEVRATPSTHGLVVTFRDVTARRDARAELAELERQLLRSQRLQSIGTLAGGLAHDLNNVLAPVLLSLELLRSGEQDPARRELLAVVEENTRRGSDVIGQLLSFARGLDGGRDRVDVSGLLHDVGRLAGETLPPSVQLTVDGPARPTTVVGDRTQLHQILLNLVLNARDAMPDGGRVVLSSDVVALDEPTAEALGLRAADAYLRIDVDDQGSGIDDTIVDRLFEPFATTKPAGAGTGLGLSTSRAIAERHGGSLRLHRTSPRGTRFRLLLPAAPGATPDTSTGSSPAPRVPVRPGRGELVLVVDDEPVLRELSRRTLERAGYRVVVAADGAAAVALHAARACEVALVVTDLAMPGMDGRDLLRTLRTRTPSLPALVTSGLCEDASPESRTDARLQKPFTGSELVAAVRAALTPTHPAAPAG